MYFVFCVHIVVFIGDIAGIYLGWNVCPTDGKTFCPHVDNILNQ
jgi:hypothetical protein